MKRRRLYVFHLGDAYSRKWGSPDPIKMLERVGIKAKNAGGIITAVSRAGVDVSRELGKPYQETLLSIAGYTYSSISKIKLYAYPEDLELIKVIIRGCEYEILDSDSLPENMR